MATIRPRVLVISLGSVGREMAGNGIRAFELARTLRAHAQVALAAPVLEVEPEAELGLIRYDPRHPTALRQAVAHADAIITQPQRPVVARWLRRSGSRLIFDLYDPEPFEVMEVLAGRHGLRRLVSTSTLDRILESLHSGHHFVCASSKQRDLWIGMMLAARLLTPSIYDRDPSLLSIIDEVPFGVPDRPPHGDGQGPRERFAPELSAADEIVLWNGGIWSWLDAPAAIRAIALLEHRRPQAKLVFMGRSAGMPAQHATEEARRIAAELGVLNRRVFFHEAWVPYGERDAWLRQADCAISTHIEHLETRFAFRTRLLDCFWSGLPVVCTQGDELAARVEGDDLGAVVPQDDPEAIAAGLENVLERGRGAFARALASTAADYAWPRVVKPLVRFATLPQLPPRLGEGRRLSPRQVLRSGALEFAAKATGAAGLKVWPGPEA